MMARLMRPVNSWRLGSADSFQRVDQPGDGDLQRCAIALAVVAGGRRVRISRAKVPSTTQSGQHDGASVA
jgi:hypothetical protein